jgi:hypothetical protein
MEGDRVLTAVLGHRDDRSWQCNLAGTVDQDATCWERSDKKPGTVEQT